MTQSPALRIALRRALQSADANMVLASNDLVPLRPGAPRAGRTALVIDADMPGLGGEALTERISDVASTSQIIVVTSDAARGKTLRVPVTRAGAAAFFILPVTDHPSELKPIATQIAALLRSSKPAARRSVSQLAAPEAAAPRPVRARRRIKPEILVIGSSTGGPQALITLFSDFSPATTNVPVLIVQHMPAAFTPVLAEHISRSTAWRAREAQHGEGLAPGEVRIAPGGVHLSIKGRGANAKLALTDDPPVNFCRPSADVLFFAAAEQFGAGVLAVILTGMGHDGAAGGRAINAAGGTVLAQDEETSVVWGMPGAAVAAGVVERVVALPAMGTTVARALSGETPW
ncbi:chemotaxis protein CheB [Acuticoccus sp. MNP-M23]|uniref:chemotaxis protein CheB n=1 Tax=Acuticoccus sp. MNP-M23 TaxID=3072793 RepID=UPI002815D095|nr:chemotaxis protein CheB [Acuticoccus sp. MNP-M23]WMS41822.1 chemotaxis protein CheB [Acuticoccus sp. MNP-M23]